MEGVSTDKKPEQGTQRKGTVVSPGSTSPSSSPPPYLRFSLRKNPTSLEVSCDLSLWKRYSKNRDPPGGLAGRQTSLPGTRPTVRSQRPTRILTLPQGPTVYRHAETTHTTGERGTGTLKGQGKGKGRLSPQEEVVSTFAGIFGRLGELNVDLFLSKSLSFPESTQT